MKQKIILAVLIISGLSFCSLVLMSNALSAGGDLDTSFNGTGSARLGFGRNDDQVTGVAAQADGKLVVVGISRSRKRIQVFRYNTNGLLDSTFGGLGLGKA